MKELIRQHALELGFDRCRFTTAEPPASQVRYQEWIAAGCHGEMDYLRRHAPLKADLNSLLPGVQSVIVLGASYHLADHQEERAPPLAQKLDGGHGIVARYARFADYHDPLRAALQELAGQLQSLGGESSRCRIFVDSGPVLERDLAQRSGLGFVGKHTHVIHQQFGNWLFLAEILTTLPLEPDSPARNRCGSCTACLAACPTHAIIAPFKLDARRCISYLTIELKGSIPPEFRPAMGARIFGCDDCLEVCPWNRFAQAGRLMPSHYRADLEEPDLIELLSLEDDAFRRRFRETPLWRGKRRRLLRNVCVALGNVGQSAALPMLERAGTDPEPLIAEHARWAIEQIEKRQPGPRYP